MLVPHLLKIYFGLGWPSSALEIVSSQRLITNKFNHSSFHTPVPFYLNGPFFISEGVSAFGNILHSPQFLLGAALFKFLKVRLFMSSFNNGKLNDFKV